jgi:ABC-type nitrate/sulfonate/bicarbonate transport system permease component
MLRSLCAAFSVFAASGVAFAHPGHSTVAASIAEWLHLMLSPAHLLGTIAAVLLALGLAIAVAIRLSRKERRNDSR